MVVTGSRKEAVRWQKATRKYIADHGYKIEALVAFSGEVIDPESGPDPFTEHSKELNPKLAGQDIRTAFKSGDYQLLLVANKFQTGFDEPLLCAMYVDKRLGGIQAVQTLSRLNRCYPGKDQTYVVDFVNDPADILAAFKPYYETAELSGVTDPYIVHDLKAKLDGQALYDTFEVDRVVNVAHQGQEGEAVGAGRRHHARGQPAADGLCTGEEGLRGRPGDEPRRRRRPRTRWTR
jgi:type I restriction enzyme R subunit